MTNAGYYVTDNWRLSVGVSWLDEYGALQLGSEYLLEDFAMPMAVTGELRIGQDRALRGMLGLRTYIGPNPHKSLVLRHREDDPADRSTALYAAAGGRTLVATGSVANFLGDSQSPIVHDNDSNGVDQPECAPPLSSGPGGVCVESGGSGSVEP